MMADDRIFRVTRGGYGNDRVSYHTRLSVGGMFGKGYYNSLGGRRRQDILRVEATNAGATDGWTDVTSEFRDKPEPGCSMHKGYTGVRRPAVARWEPDDVRRWFKSCRCWGIYAGKHPEYPRHDPLCAVTPTDPATCPCRILSKITE